VETSLFFRKTYSLGDRCLFRTLRSRGSSVSGLGGVHENSNGTIRVENVASLRFHEFWSLLPSLSLRALSAACLSQLGASNGRNWGHAAEAGCVEPLGYLSEDAEVWAIVQRVAVAVWRGGSAGSVRNRDRATRPGGRAGWWAWGSVLAGATGLWHP